MQTFKSIGFILLLAILAACSGKPTQAPPPEEQPYFEGEITVSESRVLYGSLFKVHTTYILSENSLKREQRLGGINSIAGSYAGIIIDLEKDSVVLYCVDELQKKRTKYTTTVSEFKSSRRSFPHSLPSPVDNTMLLLPDPVNKKQINQVKDSTKIQGFTCDYTLYNDESGILKQEIYDSKEIRVKREMLEMVFRLLPEDINFILRSDLRTTITDLSNDTIISGTQTKALDAFLRDVFHEDGKAPETERTDLDKLAKNKWVNLGINILKKSVDLQIQISSDLSDISLRSVKLGEFSLPSGDFDEVDDLDDFLDELPSEGGGDWDD